MSEIQKKIKEFSDEFLLDQYYNKRHEYTPDAVAFMEEEIAARNLNGKDKSDDHNSLDNPLTEHMQEEFVPFDQGFSQTDLLLAGEILREENIPFYVDAALSSDTLPLESEASHYFTIHVPKRLLEKVRESLNQFFDKSDGRYSVKYSNPKERLKAFCFHEIQLSWEELNEEIGVHFTAQESSDILKLIERLSNEVDNIEQQSGKVLFYFDNLKECSHHISEKNRSGFSRADLLTILEVLQVYCDSEDFPQSLNNTSDTLLNFLTT